VMKSEPINIKVLKSSSGQKRASKDFSLDLKIDKSKFYLGESIMLTVYFKQRSNVNVMQIEYTPPAFKEFFSKQIGEGKTYRKGVFTIQELNYMLIAKRAGKLSLEPARARVAQQSRQRQGGWFMDVPKWTKISSPALSVEVLEPNEPHDLVGAYHLSDSVDHLKVKSNKPVTLKMELFGKGTLDDYDGIHFDIPSVTMYSDDAKIESKLLGKELQSRYAKSFVFISDHNFTIPSKEIRAYNYKTAKVEVLKTKAYSIEVEGSKETISRPVVQRSAAVQSNMTPQKPLASWQERLLRVLALI